MSLNQEKTYFALYIGSILLKVADRQALTEEEQRDLDIWKLDDQRRGAILDESMDRQALVKELRLLDERYDSEQAVLDLFQVLGISPKVAIRGRRTNSSVIRWLSAAAVLLFVFAGAWYYIVKQKGFKQVASSETHAQNEVLPGGNKAVLTLSDGSAIVLDSAADGLLSRQGNTKVIKSGAGQLAYDAGTGAGNVVYNTITTPRGGQYQVQLPDGSKVWLNAASSLRFPTSFSGRSREVQISGEAYFDIAKDAGKPFSVRVNGMSVEVLGTQFNINAYTDEPAIKTTLLDGSVRVISGGAMALLAPGQQAQAPNTSAGGQGINDAAGIRLVKNANLQEVVAWKNGLFYLSSADISAVMRQLARWYDVDINFEGEVPSGHITGRVPRNTSLSIVLKVLETSGVHFRIEGKKIIVSPQAP